MRFVHDSTPPKSKKDGLGIPCLTRQSVSLFVCEFIRKPLWLRRICKSVLIVPDPDTGANYTSTSAEPLGCRHADHTVSADHPDGQTEPSAEAEATDTTTADNRQIDRIGIWHMPNP